MNCPADDRLHAYLDGELDPLGISELKNHLQTCAACQTRSQALSATALRVRAHLASLDAPLSPASVDPQIALGRFKANLPVPEARLPFLARIFSRRVRFAWAVSLTAIILVVSLLFPGTRSFAQRLLATLRIQKVETVALDFGSLDNESSRKLQQALQQMISKEVVVTANEKEQPASSRDAATQLAGFPVRLLSSRTDSPSFRVSGNHAFHMNIDRARLQEVLDEAGRSDLILPATLDGATVSVRISRGVEVSYGNCAHEARLQPQPAPAAAASPAPANPCLVLIEALSPEVNVPADLNLQQLAETALQLAGMNPTQARQFGQSIDWKTTLVLPIPSNVRSTETVNINGVQGTLLHFPSQDRPSYALIWVNGGIIYNLVGWGDSSTAVQTASSLD